MHQVRHARKLGHVHLQRGADASGGLAIATNAINIAPDCVLQQHAPIRQARFGCGEEVRCRGGADGL